MPDLKKARIVTHQNSINYHFDDFTFKIENGSLGYKEFYLTASSVTFFADNIKFEPLEIYTTKQRDHYVISVYFDKAFPLIHRDEPSKIIWSTYRYKEASYKAPTIFNWLKDGETIITVNRKQSLFSDEELWVTIDIAENYFELFLSLLYTFNYPKYSSDFKDMSWV